MRSDLVDRDNRAGMAPGPVCSSRSIRVTARLTVICVTALIVTLAACKAQARPELIDAAAQPAAVEQVGEQEAKAAPRIIDPDKLRLSFIADFNDSFSVSPWGCVTDWIAHTPWHGDFGDATFADPVKTFPFTIEDGALAIEARRFDDGTWQTGMLSARDVCNSGWSQLYGYFEIRAKMPDAPGFWPTFWLIGVNPKIDTGTSEIDVVEHYTARPDTFTSGVIKHPGLVDTNKRVSGHTHEVEPGLMTDHFNMYGVEIDPKETTFYFNRVEIFSVPTEPEFRQPFFPLVSMAVIADDVTRDTPDSVKMYVDYIRAYQRMPE